MAMTREEEERQRVARALENVEKWKERYGGFSGGFRISYSDGATVEQTIGNPVLAKKVLPAPSPLPPPQAISERPPIPPPSDVKVRRPRHWLFGWLFNLISTET